MCSQTRARRPGTAQVQGRAAPRRVADMAIVAFIPPRRISIFVARM
jgi:hypothetical protein